MARRLEEVELRLNEKQSTIIAPTKDWRTVVGVSGENECTRLVRAEIESAREDDLPAALAEQAP